MASTTYRPAGRALLLVLCLSLWCATDVNARLSNVVTDWIVASQVVAAFVGAHEGTTTQWYALLSVAIYNSVVTGNLSLVHRVIQRQACHAQLLIIGFTGVCPCVDHHVSTTGL